MIMFYANLEFVLNALFGSNLAYSTFPTHFEGKAVAFAAGKLLLP